MQQFLEVWKLWSLKENSEVYAIFFTVNKCHEKIKANNVLVSSSVLPDATAVSVALSPNQSQTGHNYKV